MKIATAVMLLLWTGAALAARPHKAPAAAAAPSSAPARALAEIPALPKVAKKDLDCSASEVFGARIQQQLQKDEAATQAAEAKPFAPQALSDEQTQALQALNDPEFYSCLTDLQQRPPELWILPLREKLDAKLTEVDAARSRADEKYCASHASEGCGGDPAGGKRFNPQAVAAGTQYLKDAQPAYAGYLKEISDCLARREKIIATARGAGVGGPMEAMMLSGTQLDWTFVGIAAGAQSAVCTGAREAASRYLEQP